MTELLTDQETYRTSTAKPALCYVVYKHSYVYSHWTIDYYCSTGTLWSVRYSSRNNCEVHGRDIACWDGDVPGTDFRAPTSSRCFDCPVFQDHMTIPLAQSKHRREKEVCLARHLAPRYVRTLILAFALLQLFGHRVLKH